MKCPHCNSEVEYIPGESELCSECGGELRQEVSEPAKEPSSDAFTGFDWAAALTKIKEKSPTPEVELQASKLCSSVRNSVASDQEWNLSARAKMFAEAPDSEDCSRFNSGECPYLQLEYNKNIFFISGSESVIKLRITPLSGELNNLLIFMTSRIADNDFRIQIPVTEVIRKDRPVVVRVPFNPEKCSGYISITFYIGCQIGSKITYFQFSVEHKVYDPNQTSASIGSQIVINQKFEAQHAADINYRSNLGDAIRELAEKNISSNELIDRLNNMPPDYRKHPLSESVWRPENFLVSGDLYHTEKLVLEWNGYSLFLVGKKDVLFGRDPEQVDIVVRVGGGRISPREYPNATVSRKHAQLIYCEDAVKIFDHSSYGTYIDGRKPDNAGIPVKENALVEFGDIHWMMNTQKCEMRSVRNICQTCPANAVKSMTFTRQDDEKECYLLIWQCCELGKLFPELADWNVFYRDRSFFIRTPDQKFFYLRPGHSIESNNQRINVTYFK